MLELILLNCALSMLVGVIYGVEAQKELWNVSAYLKQAHYLSLFTLLISISLYLMGIIHTGNVASIQTLQSLIITFSSQLSYYALAILIDYVVGLLYAMAGLLIGYMLNPS